MIALVVLLGLLMAGTAHAEQVIMSKADFAKVLNKFVMLQSQLKELEKQAVLTAKATADPDKIISELKGELAKLEELVSAHKELDGLNDRYIKTLEERATMYEQRMAELDGWHPGSVEGASIYEVSTCRVRLDQSPYRT